VSVAIIDYGSGNLRSAAKAFERAAADAGTGERILVTDRAADLRDAARIVLPGVGAFADCMAGLAALPGMAEALGEAVLAGGRPFLGICVGMQLMASRGLEHGSYAGLDWIEGDVVALPHGDGLKVPHMGWNALEDVQPHPVLDGLGDGTHVYFVHSYVFRPADPARAVARARHGGAFAAAVGRDNMVGTQFHPEKSQAAGLRLIANFLTWRP
jgi:imidazole glycerol-phosphate synthase subunit HisH